MVSAPSTGSACIGLPDARAPWRGDARDVIARRLLRVRRLVDVGAARHDAHTELREERAPAR